MKIGIIREGKIPTDSRVPLTPTQCAQLLKRPGLEVMVQPAHNRCFSNEEYRQAGIPMGYNLMNCDILLGVKEVPVSQLIPNRTYCFFSHTIKEQAYNRELLRAILEKKIKLIDYEALTDEKGQRLIAFGRFAGMVGAHNALMTYGWRTKSFELPRLKECKDYREARTIYKTVDFPACRIVLTGNGRVANGAAEVLDDMGIEKVSADEFLTQEFEHAVFTQLDCKDYAERIDGAAFELNDFFRNPKDYQSKFLPFTQRSDIMINGIYWDNNAPAFFTKEEMRQPGWTIKVIADITCDIAPNASIPATLRASTIDEPVFGYDLINEIETEPFGEGVVDMMTVDNLPNELPRDASEAFGEQLIRNVLPELLKEKSEIIERATVAEGGHLGRHFRYLESFVSAS